MSNYWQILLIDGEPVRVTPEQKANLEQAILKGEKHVKVDEELIAVSNITKVEETQIPVPPPNAGLLVGAKEEERERVEKRATQGEVMKYKDDEGKDQEYRYDPPVVTRWGKKFLTKRQLKKKESPRILERSGDGAFVAAPLIVWLYKDTGEEVPCEKEYPGWEWCDQTDLQILGVA